MGFRNNTSRSDIHANTIGTVQVADVINNINHLSSYAPDMSYAISRVSLITGSFTTVLEDYMINIDHITNRAREITEHATLTNDSAYVRARFFNEIVPLLYDFVDKLTTELSIVNQELSVVYLSLESRIGEFLAQARQYTQMHTEIKYFLLGVKQAIYLMDMFLEQINTVKNSVLGFKIPKDEIFARNVQLLSSEFASIQRYFLLFKRAFVRIVETY